MKSARVLLTLALVAIPATAFAQIKVGSRVGTPAGASGYDDGGRPDPFVSLVIAKRGVPVPSALDAAPRPGTLRSLAIVDVKCTGVMKSGGRWQSAIVEGPNKMSFQVRVQDRLLDGVVKSIDATGVVFIARTTDVSGAVEGHEVKKLLHPAAEVIR